MALKRHKLDRSLPVRRQAADVVQNAIMKGLLQPGEKLHQRTLAIQFQLSHSAVREVLIELENRGLLVKSGSSYTIAQYSEDECSDLMMVRALLEPAACRLAAEHWTARLNTALEACLARMEGAFGSRDVLLAWECDREFHRIIRRHQPNRELETHLEKVSNKLFAFYLSHLVTAKSDGAAQARRILAEHALIVKVLRTRDGARAERLARRMVEQASRRMFESWNGGKAPAAPSAA